MTATVPLEKWDKLDKIRYLLDSWDLIFDPNACSPYGTPGDGSGIPLMPRMSRHPSVIELARCLKVLSHVAPGDYRHLTMFRVGCEWRLIDVDARFRGPNGKWLTLKQRQRQRIVPSWIDQQRVARAEQQITEWYEGEPFIPDELWEALTKPAEVAA